MKEIVGGRTIDCARYVVNHNSDIERISFRPYQHIPNRVDLNEVRYWVSRDVFLDGFDPIVFLENLDEKYNLVISSEIETKAGEIAHLLLMDLQPNISDENLIKIQKLVSEEIVPYFGAGFLIQSGKSYQFFGENITDMEGWLDFMGRWLVTCMWIPGSDGKSSHRTIADYKYVGFSLLRRSAGLRVTSFGEKKIDPRVIAVVGKD